MGNISYMSIMSDAFGHLLTSTKTGRVVSFFQRPLARTFTKHYSWRLRRKFYKNAPELAVVRKIREHLFYGKGNNPFTLWAKYIGIHLDRAEGRQQIQAKSWKR